MSKRLCHRSWQAVFQLNTWLLWFAWARQRQWLLHQNEFTFDSWVWNMEWETTLMLQGLTPSLLSETSPDFTAITPSICTLSRLQPPEHCGASKTGRAVSPVPLPQQFQQINRMCNNCFTSNSVLQMHPHFIRLKFWQRQTETRQGHKLCVPGSGYIDSRQAPSNNKMNTQSYFGSPEALWLCFSLQSEQIFI